MTVFLLQTVSMEEHFSYHIVTKVRSIVSLLYSHKPYTRRIRSHDWPFIRRTGHNVERKVAMNSSMKLLTRIFRTLKLQIVSGYPMWSSG